jgi:hypothetical protein
MDADSPGGCDPWEFLGVFSNGFAESPLAWHGEFHLTVEIEKVWNAIIGVIWQTIETATGIALSKL